jgi:hypothetical protein
MASVGLPYVSNVPNMGGGLSLSNDAPNFAYNVNTASKGLNLLSGLLDLSKAKGDQLTKARIKTTSLTLNSLEKLADQYETDLPDLEHGRVAKQLISNAKNRLFNASNSMTDPTKDDVLQEELRRATSILMDPDASGALQGVKQENAQLKKITRQNSLQKAQNAPIKEELMGRMAMSKLGAAQPEDVKQSEVMSRVLGSMGAGNAAIPTRPRTQKELVQNVPPAILGSLGSKALSGISSGARGQNGAKQKIQEKFDAGLPKQVATIMNDVAKKHENPEGIKQAFTNVFSSIKSVLTGKDAKEFLSLSPKEQKEQVEETLNDAGIDVSTLSPNAKSKLAFAVRVELMKLKNKKVKTSESSLDEKINKLVQ